VREVKVRSSRLFVRRVEGATAESTPLVPRRPSLPPTLASLPSPPSCCCHHGLDLCNKDVAITILQLIIRGQYHRLFQPNSPQINSQSQKQKNLFIIFSRSEIYILILMASLKGI
jgi:hypothetical protein